jgi:hypothetical protein
MKGVPALSASMKSLLNISKNDDIEKREWYEVWHPASGNLVYWSDTYEEADQWRGDADDLDILHVWNNGKDMEPVP